MRTEQAGSVRGIEGVKATWQGVKRAPACCKAEDALCPETEGRQCFHPECAPSDRLTRDHGSAACLRESCLPVRARIVLDCGRCRVGKGSTGNAVGIFILGQTHVAHGSMVISL